MSYCRFNTVFFSLCRLGSGYFAFLIAVFAVLCDATTIGLAILAENLFRDSSYLSQCAVGFSG